MIERTYEIKADVSLYIALVTDLHGDDGTAVLRSLQRHSPDLIAIAGDFIYGRRPRENGERLDVPVIAFQKNVQPFLKGCTAVAPTFVSLGNHETFLDDEDISLIRKTGVTLLDNASVVFGNVVIGGLTSGRVLDYRAYRKKHFQENGRTERYPGRTRRQMPKRFPVDHSWLDEFEKQEGYKILLCHHPEYWGKGPVLSERKLDLVLSGHAHGGQFRLFNRGLYAPGQGFLPKYTRGIYPGTYGSMVVSAGLSNTSAGIPRFQNPEEIVFLRLIKNTQI